MVGPKQPRVGPACVISAGVHMRKNLKLVSRWARFPRDTKQLLKGGKKAGEKRYKAGHGWTISLSKAGKIRNQELQNDAGRNQARCTD